MTEAHIKSIESVLKKGDRVMLIPVKYGVVVKRIHQETVLQPPKHGREDA